MSDYRVMAIDPGPGASAYVFLGENMIPLGSGMCLNSAVLALIGDRDFNDLAIEGIQSFGMAVGRSVFDTAYMIGRFLQEYERHTMQHGHIVYRRDVKQHLCGLDRAKDTNIRHAIYDKYGGSRQAAVGIKRAPGPLYGMKSHTFSALAVGITFMETIR